MKGPEPWKDEEAMETDLQTLLSMYLINHEEVELKALGHGEPEPEEGEAPGDEQEDRKEGGEE